MRLGNVMIWLVAANTVVAQQGSPMPAGEQPATAVKGSAWPIVAPTQPWFDEARVAERVAAMRPLVEKHTGLTFRRDPIVLVASEGSWTRLVAEEIPQGRDRALVEAITFALYVPAHESVVLNPFIAHKLLSTEDGKPAPRAADAHAILAHELVHVLQQQHFELPARMKAETDVDTKRVLKAMVEGFATWAEQRIATEDLALADYARRNAAMHRRNARMEYVRGHDFFARLHERGGLQAMHDAMRNEPLSLYEFARIAVAKPTAKAAEPKASPPAEAKGK